jgi:hypothetical protein
MAHLEGAPMSEMLEEQEHEPPDLVVASEGHRDAQPFRGGGRAIVVALVVALVGAAGFVAALLVDGRQALTGYLISYFFAVTVFVGLLAFVMGAHAMSAAWPTTIRRICEAALGSAPLLVVLYLPLFWSASRLYPWAHPERVADHHRRMLVEHKLPVMNAPFFYVRAVFYLVLFAVVAELLRRWSLAMDRPSPPDHKPRLRAFSALLLPPVGMAGTFAAFDWIMSLSPDFYSTMYGLYALSGGFVATVGLIAILCACAQRAGWLLHVKRSHWYALGRLLFAFLIFWAYTGFFQYMLIWIGNKPIEARYFVERIRPDDRWTSWFLVYGHFLVPWVILLSYYVKRHRWSVTAMGAWILACHYVDVHWLVGADRGGRPAWRWEDAPPLLLIGGLLVAFALWRQRGQLLSAFYDPDFVEGTQYESR